jgi:hypothetical protein
MEPILPLQFGSAKEVPLVEETMRDPKIEENSVHSAEEASARRDRARTIENQLEIDSKINRRDSYLSLVELYASIAYYYTDGFDGKQDLNEARTAQIAVIKYADLLANSSNKKTAEFARASYIVHTTRYLIGSTRDSSIKNLRFLIDKSKLNLALKRRAEFLVNVWDVEHGRSQELAKLKRSIGSLPKTGAIAARLAIARYEAGINPSGNKSGATRSTYKGFLATAAKRSSTLQRSQSQKVLSFSLAIWRTAEGTRSPWAKPPFNLAAYSEFLENRAVTERQALDSWAKGKSAIAIGSYKNLSKSFSGEKQMDDLDRRVLDLEEIVYQKTGKFKSYEGAIVSTYSKYSSEQAGTQKAELMVANVKRRHGKLVHSELITASTQPATKAKRLDAINLAERYLVHVNEIQEKESVKSSVANLWVLNNEHKRAVRIYLELASEINPAKKSEYLTLAIASQRVVAKWPQAAPWRGITKESMNERTTLLAIYKDLNSTRASLDWALVSHIGQLYIHTNQKDEAYKIWMASLKTSPKGSDASFAAGMMITDYQIYKHWQNSENVARLCLAAKLVPVFNGRSIDTNTALALALLEGGKVALAKHDHGTAVSKLAEFVAGFRAANRDEGMFLLATAYRDNSKHEKSIETLLAFSEEYPGSTYFRQAMLNGGDWSVPMAYEENAMYFYETFLKRFIKDGEGIRVRDELADIYLGRRLYAEAGAIMTKQMSDKEISANEREGAGLRLIRMEEKFGSKDRAAMVAEEVLKEATNQTVRSEALGAQARQHATKGQVASLVKIEHELNSMDERSAVQETLGESRFLLAAASLQPILKPINSLVLTDPKATISTRYREFTNMRNSFQSVCEAGETSYCVPALQRIARIAERLITIIEDVTIPPTVADATIKAFDREKSFIINSLSKESLAADAKSGKLAERGYTNPEWIQQVYWQNSSDVNFERVSGEEGRAYIQWPVANDD